MMREWVQGGTIAREITPLGYCGDPSDIDLESEVVEGFAVSWPRDTANLIRNFLPPRVDQR